MFCKENFGTKIGILGGGQLAQMLSRSAKRLGFGVEIFSDEANPCSNLDANITVSDFNHLEEIQHFAKKCDFITIETENIPSGTIKFLEEQSPKKITTSSSFVEISQNRIKEKKFAQSLGITTAPFSVVKSHHDITTFFEENGASILKTATQGYDGKGQTKITNKTDISTIPLNVQNTQYIIEKVIDFHFEVSVIATKQGENLVIFPIPHNIHSEGILRESHIYGKISKQIVDMVSLCAKNVSKHIQHTGTFAIEFFVVEDSIIFNEMAPRVHNSGHFSQNLCNVCQFENHIRAITNLPIIQPKLLHYGKMVNIIGRDIHNLDNFLNANTVQCQAFENSDNFLDKPNNFIHLYGKSFAENRKMGHVNIID